MSETFYQVVGCIGFAMLIAAIILVQRAVARLQNRGLARSMLRLAEAVGGVVDHADSNDNPAVVAEYQGCSLRAFASPKTSAGQGDTALTINAFIVLIAEVSGQQGWTARFHVTGMLGQGPRELRIETADRALGERLIAAGVLEALQKYCAGTADYAAASYDARTRLLSVMDDVMPRLLPAAEHFVRQAQLAVRVSQLNELHNR